MRCAFVAVLAILLVASSAFAEPTVWYVHPDSALNTIQAALDSCADNDIVLVAPGTYYENILWPNSIGIQLISALGPELTFIDGGGLERVVIFDHYMDSTTVIRGFTIQNGYCATGGGAGLLCVNAASPKIDGNTITGNSTTYSGAGIGCDNGAAPTISYNTIYNNYADGSGGGIACFNNSHARIIYNTISGNSTGYSGGAMSFMGNQQTWIIGNTISRNTTYSSGGGIYFDYTFSIVLSGNTISENEVLFFGSSYGGGLALWTCSGEISGNVITGNYNYYEGGGIFANACTLDISGNTISGNSVNTNGGGIYLTLSEGIIHGNTITGNSANRGGGIDCNNTSPVILNNTIGGNTGTYGAGITCLMNAMPDIDSCTISNNIGDGFYCYAGANPTINYCNIEDNTGYGVCNLDANVMIDAENNWWGDGSGPYHPISNPGGIGDSVTDYVDFIPWLGVPVGAEEEPDLRHKTSALRLTAYPNPFSHEMSIWLQGAPERGTGETEIQIYDLSGRLVKRFSLPTAYSILPTGIIWDGKNRNGQPVMPGVYFVRCGMGGIPLVKKIVRLK